MITLTIGETVLELDPRRATVRIVASSGPVLEDRPAAEDPAEYKRAVRMLRDGALLLDLTQENVAQWARKAKP